MSHFRDVNSGMTGAVGLRGKSGPRLVLRCNPDPDKGGEVMRLEAWSPGSPELSWEKPLPLLSPTAGANDRVGIIGMCRISDVDNDGDEDLAVSIAVWRSYTKPQSILLISGSTGKLLSVVHPPLGATEFGFGMTCAENLDGDGKDCLIVSARLADNTVQMYRVLLR